TPRSLKHDPNNLLRVGEQLRHGLTAETVIGALEDAEDYQAFEGAITADYDAQSDTATLFSSYRGRYARSTGARLRPTARTRKHCVSITTMPDHWFFGSCLNLATSTYQRSPLRIVRHRLVPASAPYGAPLQQCRLESAAHPHSPRFACPSSTVQRR